MPWAVVDTAISLTIANPSLKTATQLDINGNRQRKLKPIAENQSLKLTLPRDALYVGARGEMKGRPACSRV